MNYRSFTSCLICIVLAWLKNSRQQDCHLKLLSYVTLHFVVFHSLRSLCKLLFSTLLFTLTLLLCNLSSLLYILFPPPCVLAHLYFSPSVAVAVTSRSRWATALLTKYRGREGEESERWRSINSIFSWWILLARGMESTRDGTHKRLLTRSCMKYTRCN